MAARVVLQLKIPYHDGTTHVVMESQGQGVALLGALRTEPLEFMQRLFGTHSRATLQRPETLDKIGSRRVLSLSWRGNSGERGTVSIAASDDDPDQI